MTAPINEGNSGGPVIDENGNLIGIAQGGLIRRDVENVRIASKISTVAAALGVLVWVGWRLFQDWNAVSFPALTPSIPAALGALATGTVGPAGPASAIRGRVLFLGD